MTAEALNSTRVFYMHFVRVHKLTVSFLGLVEVGSIQHVTGVCEAFVLRNSTNDVVECNAGAYCLEANCEYILEGEPDPFSVSVRSTSFCATHYFVTRFCSNLTTSAHACPFNTIFHNCTW